MIICITNTPWMRRKCILDCFLLFFKIYLENRENINTTINATKIKVNSEVNFGTLDGWTTLCPPFKLLRVLWILDRKFPLHQQNAHLEQWILKQTTSTVLTTKSLYSEPRYLWQRSTNYKHLYTNNTVIGSSFST